MVDYLNASAEELDALDELASLRSQFYLPIFSAVEADLVEATKSEEPCTYLCGNSLGALAKRSEELIKEELKVWATRAVEGHLNHPHDRPWLPIADTLTPALASLIGAEPSEVACMGTLTSNLHLMMASFYKPTKERFKIICEANAFPSDRYAFHSQAKYHGFDPEDAVIEISPRAGEYTLREKDILAIIKEHGPTTALVLFSGVQFYTGQWFPMESITKAGHDEGCFVGWDLAHTIGNVPIQLHEWNVDFAVWCTYKYLNSGPGGIGGLFVHSNWDEKSPPRLHGWWGHDRPTRFKMPHKFSQTTGAGGYQQSNPSALLAVALMGSLQMFQSVPSLVNTPSDPPGVPASELRRGGGADAGLPMDGLRRKSVRMTGWLEARLRESKFFVELPSNSSTSAGSAGLLQTQKNEPAKFTIITPSDPSSRGAQLSLLWPSGEGIIMQRVFKGLKRRGVIGDEREPDVIRLAPCPMYNNWSDCARAVRCLEEVLEEVAKGVSK